MNAPLEIIIYGGSTEPVPNWSLRYDERCALYYDRDCPGCNKICMRIGGHVWQDRTRHFFSDGERA